MSPHLRFHAEIFSFFFQGKATGNKAALRLRVPVQNNLFKWGSLLQRNPGKLLLPGILALAFMSACLQSASMETKVEKLWVQGKKKN